MKNAIARFLCVLVLLAIPVSLLAASDRDYRDERGWNVEGTVISVDNNKKTIDIYDRSNKYYTIDADDATIYIEGKERSIRDIRRNERIRVYGQERSDRYVSARTIYKIDNDRDRDDDNWGQPRYQINGYIKKIEKNGTRIDLKTGNSSRKIIINSDTKIISDRGRNTRINDLDEGDLIYVVGYKGKGNDTVAIEIRPAGRSGYTNNRRDTQIQARVIRDTTLFSRTLRVADIRNDSRLPDEFDVDVDKDVRITKNGKSISVHDIRRGDYIRLEGYWNGSKYDANRITVNSDNQPSSDYDKGRDYRTLDGTIRSIDYREKQFVLSTDDGSRTVYADRARIWNDGDSDDFDSLRRGDKVRVRGNIRDKSVDAEIIEREIR
ncbi:MAG: DUF5666 domain-containing protein [Armatimonadota bacterium]